MSMASATAGKQVRPMTREEKKVILASSLGTVFEWYDFYLYGSLAVMIGAQFFSAFDATTRNVFALLAFAAGFLVRPFGALVFGRLGDLVGRKYTFLITILIMGSSTFLVGLLPSYATIGWVAPVILIALRMAQGLALGGEYGGAAVYVAEHAPVGPPRLLHVVDPDDGDAGPAALADRHSRAAHVAGRSGVRGVGLAHSVPALDLPARDLGLDSSPDGREPCLQEDEGRGHAVQGAAVGSLRPVEERSRSSSSRCSASSPARPWSGTRASSTRCSSCRAF